MDEEKYLKIENNKVVECDISATEINIPDDITSIGDYAFSYCDSLRRITIPNSVTSIGDYAFRYCTRLTSITIPNSVTSIGNEAFRDCTSLTSITIPDSITSIGDYAFSECRSLPSVTIPNSVTSIGSHAFSLCTSLTSITIPDGVTSISNSTFAGCKNLTSITIPNSVTEIGDGAFFECCLLSITIPNSVTSIGNRAFDNCLSLTSITIPNSVISIGNWAFNFCTHLTDITIPSSVTSIGKYAFDFCTSLTSIIVEEGNIKYDSRNNCNAIIETSTNTLIVGCKNTIIPNSVTKIGEYAFAYCNNLTDVYFCGDKNDWDKIDIGGGNNRLLNAKIHFNDEKFNLFNCEKITSLPNNLEDFIPAEIDFKNFINVLADIRSKKRVTFSSTEQLFRYLVVSILLNLKDTQKLLLSTLQKLIEDNTIVYSILNYIQHSDTTKLSNLIQKYKTLI